MGAGTNGPGRVARWLDGAAASARREVAALAGNRAEVFFCIVLPVLWMLVVWGLLGQGVITDVPVGFVDNDKTSLSRSIARALDANRAVALESRNSREEALAAMRQGALYGVIVIPAGYTRDTLAGRGSSVILYLDENRYAVAGTLQAEVSSVISALSLESTTEAALRTGSGVAGARRLVSVVHSDFYALGNMQMSFLAFLGGSLMPGVLMIGAMLGFVTAILREQWRDSVGEWFATAGGSPSAALCGKLLPHYGVYCGLFLFYIALFAGQGGWGAAGSVLLWFACGAACVAAFAAAAILVTGIAPSWRLALVVASGYAAPALPFTGFSIPLDSMHQYVRAFAHCLPLTWLLEGQSQQWVLGAGAGGMGTTFAAFGLLIAVPLLAGYPVFRWRYRRLAREGVRP